MREHKYRGWHTTQKVMFSCEQMVADQMTLLPDGRFINVNGSSTNLSVIYPKDKFIPIQYTGLKDKNGKEIYENDVVKVGLVSDTGIIEKHVGKVTFEDFEYCIETTDSFWPVASWKCVDTCEVIGNIYENPELLGDKDV